MKTLTLQDTLPKGKYKGLKISNVIKKDPQYIIKSQENLKSFSFDENVISSAYDEITNFYDEETEFMDFYLY